MDTAQVQERFQRFAAPLAFYRRLGGSSESLRILAQNLWVACLAGAAQEEQFWAQLAAEGADPGMVASLRACYEEEMKPALSAADLAALRAKYQIRAEPP